MCLVIVVCVCVLRLLRYDTMSCLPIVSDRAATEGSKYFESKYLFNKEEN